MAEEMIEDSFRQQLTIEIRGAWGEAALKVTLALELAAPFERLVMGDQCCDTLPSLNQPSLVLDRSSRARRVGGRRPPRSYAHSYRRLSPEITGNHGSSFK
jgi:hypothetical protein